MKDSSLTLKENWITTQTYRDLAMSVHFLVFVLMLARDLYDTKRNVFEDLCREAMGTDVVEKFFGRIAQWRNNSRTVDMEGFLTSTSNFIRQSELHCLFPEMPDGVPLKSHHRDITATRSLMKMARRGTTLTSPSSPMM